MRNMIPKEVLAYNAAQSAEDQGICDLLAQEISTELTEAENKLWHGHPVWFLEGNPIAGYSKEKKGIRLMFWSGADFEEPALNVIGKKFKDASVYITNATDVDIDDLKRWLRKSRDIQWDYKNLVKRKGKLERLKKLFSLLLILREKGFSLLFSLYANFKRRKRHFPKSSTL